MLCLNRYPGERILITLPDGRQIALAVLAITPWGKVRLGIEAPRDIEVWREELDQQARQQRRERA